MDLHLNPTPAVQRGNQSGNLATRPRWAALHPVHHQESEHLPSSIIDDYLLQKQRISPLLPLLPGTRHMRHPHPLPANPEGKARPLAFLHALLLTLVVSLILPLALPAAAQESAPLEVASGPLSERTMSLLGRSVQTPETLQLFGYVGGASGLAPQDLFAADGGEVEAARFTFRADVTLEPATNRADTSSYAGEGTLRVYLAVDGGASWSDPDSFTAGELLAEYDLALRETLQRQALQVGVLVGDGVLSQSTANSFTLGESTYRFGTEGLVQRLRYTGALTPDTAGSTLAAVVHGRTEVASRNVNVVRLGQTGTTAATPAAGDTPAAASACVLEPWLGTATSALAIADQGVGGLDLSAISAVDVDAVQGLAEEIDAAIATQRSTAVPDDAANANRLLVTALSTTSRGLRGIAEAAGSGDEASFGQASAALGDGQSLLSQARGEITELAATCPAG